jgi:hypothetical protein
LNIELQSQWQWELAPMGSGWSIKSVHSGLYLTTAYHSDKRVRIIANEYPVAWHVRIENDDPGLVRSVSHLTAMI